MKLISIVVPVFNEEETIHETVKRLIGLRNEYLEISLRLELIFVNDGSTDRSLDILEEISANNQYVKVLSFSRNFGHQIAITAGTDFAKGDFIAIIDADLQDPPELIKDMYFKSLEGYDVVYGKRSAREGETFFKKVTASLFYKFINYMSDTEIPRDTGDFRLITKKAADALRDMRESNRFVRGMVPWIGFKEAPLEYNRSARFAGETKYPLKKMLDFAFNAILSFSSKPLTIATKLGSLITFCGFIGGIYLLYLRLFTDTTVDGVTSILLSIIIFSGIQIMIIGLIGEYIARIFIEVKGRPLYVIDKKINF